MSVSEPFADVGISICLTSKVAIPKEVVALLNAQPTDTRPRGVPWTEGGGENRHRTYFQSAARFDAPQTAFQQIDHRLREHLQPFVADPETLAQLRRVCERVTIICSIRTSRNCALVPFSSETLQILATLGFEFQVISSTRASSSESNDEVA